MRGLLQLLVVGDGAREPGAVVVDELGGEDLELGRVQHHLVDRLVDQQPHPLLAGEGGGGQIGREGELVVLRLRGTRQPVRAIGWEHEAEHGQQLLSPPSPTNDANRTGRRRVRQRHRRRAAPTRTTPSSPPTG